MRSVNYPNALGDLVVVEFASPERVGIAIKPVEAGLFRLLVWPRGMPDADLVRHTLVEFPFAEGAPKRVSMSLTGNQARSFPSWDWSLIATHENANPLRDFARTLLGEEHAHRGGFEVHTPNQADHARCIFWSCHMPYKTENGRAVMEEHSLQVLNWYAQQVMRFRPHVIWGGGDTAYSDGTSAIDFSNEVYEKGNWHTNLENRAWLRREYRRMYRHFWSLDPMRRVLSAVPHLFIWDDHEIHDGWGSEGVDFQPGNVAIFEIAKEIAEEFILNSGPRVRPSGKEAHQAYVLGPMAAFIFDTRSTRNYERQQQPLLSRQQLGDFLTFLNTVRSDSNVTDLVTSTSVPFIGLRSWVTKLVTRAPDFLNDFVLKGVRDDVRDSWTSPGNLSTLTTVLGALRSFMLARPDVRVTNISGDIHVGQAYEILIPGAPSPLYQITSSAITNRTHPSGFIAALTEIGQDEYIPGVGEVRRIWKTVTKPNFLTMEFSGGRTLFNLRVWNPDTPGKSDLSLRL